MLVDTGPIVAFLNRRDSQHAWAREVLSEFPSPLKTCESAISEACFLLRSVPGGRASVLELLSRRAMIVSFDLQRESQAVRKLMAKYRNVPMALADACLVRMTEQHPGLAVVTLDTDFFQYRKHGRQAIDIISPDR